MVKEKGLQPCDTVMLKKRGWILIKCGEQENDEELMIVHRSRKLHRDDCVYNAMYLDFKEVMDGKCSCGAKIPEDFQALWTLGSFDSIAKWERKYDL